MFDIPPVTDLLALVKSPSEGAIIAPFVAIPHEVVILRDGVNDAVTPREYVFDIPPVTDLLALVKGPSEGAVIATFVAIPHEVVILRNSVNDTVHVCNKSLRACGGHGPESAAISFCTCPARCPATGSWGRR